jgi:hypothetical protein
MTMRTSNYRLGNSRNSVAPPVSPKPVGRKGKATYSSDDELAIAKAKLAEYEARDKAKAAEDAAKAAEETANKELKLSIETTKTGNIGVKMVFNGFEMGKRWLYPSEFDIFMRHLTRVEKAMEEAREAARKAGK